MLKISREKYNIQFRIQAVDNFTKTHNKFHRSLENIKRHADSLDGMKNVEINVVGDVKAKKDIKKVERAAEKLNLKNIRLMISTNYNEAWKGFRGFMGKIAHLSRDVSELFTSIFGSAIMASAPALAGSLQAVLAVGGALGPMLGSLSGGVFALATAFGAAGVAAVGFGALAFTSLSKVFEANSELKDLREELANASDEEGRLEIMKEMAEITNSLNSGQKKAIASIQSLSTAWGELSTKVEPQTIQVFTTAMSSLEALLKRLEPMFENTANAAVRLSESLKFNLEADDFIAFVGFLNTQAAPIMEDIFKGIGNFTMGLVNMMTAFGPLAETTAKGFNEMGASFREWAAGLSESERFQAFVDYVREEAPKLLSIFGGLITGLTDMFAAFGPFASDMLDRILDLVDGFKEWAATLSENEGFQNFIDYVTNHGPELLEFFGELREFLVNIVKGFSAASETMTPLITNMLELGNSFLEANPWVMKFVGTLTSLLGIVLLIYVPLRLMWTMLKIILSPIIALAKEISARLLPKFQALYAFWVNRILPVLARLWAAFLQALPTLSRIGGAFLRFLSGPVAWIIAGIVGLVIIIAKNWDELWAATKRGFQQIRDWISEKIAQVVATAVIVKGFIDTVIGYFKDLWEGVKERMSDIKDGVTGAWDSVMEFLRGINLFDIGANIISGLVGGIKSMAGSLVESAKGVVGGAIEGAKKLLKMNSPSRVFIDIGQGVGEGFVNGMDGMRRKVSGAGTRIAGAAIPSSTRTAYQGVSPAVAPNYNQRSTSSRNDVDNFEGNNGNHYTVEVPVYLNGREIAYASVDDISEMQDRKRRVIESF